MEQEVTWGVVQSESTVRRVGDADDSTVEWKAADYAPVIGDRVLLAKASSTDSWVVTGKIDGVADGPSSPVMPTGTFIQGGWTTAPAGFLLLDGVTITGGATTYPALAAMFPAWVSGSNLIPPNAAGANLLASASTPGVVSGSMSLTLTTAQLPVHAHSGALHTHSTPAHSHTVDSDSHDHSYLNYGSSSSSAQSGSGQTVRHAGGADTTGSDSHTHSISGGSGTSGAASFSTNTGNAGSGNTIDITGRTLTVRVAVKT